MHAEGVRDPQQGACYVTWWPTVMYASQSTIDAPAECVRGLLLNRVRAGRAPDAQHKSRVCERRVGVALYRSNPERLDAAAA